MNPLFFSSARKLPFARPTSSAWVCRALLLWGCVGGVAAQPTGSGMAPPTGFVFESFKYIPTPTAAAGEADKAPKRKPSQQRIVDLYTASNYTQAGTDGLGVVAAEQPDDGLKLIIANSLAWTGRLQEATAVYQSVSEPALVPDANVGIANVLRWKGQDHLAAPIYRDILAGTPGHVDALAGLEMAERELSPRTIVTLGGISDSNEFRRGAATVNHRWRDQSGFKIMEVELNGVRDTLPDVEAKQQDVTLRYQALDVPLKPAFELSVPSGTSNKVFGGLKLWMDDDRVQLDVGSVNWGRLVNNANALNLGLSATRLGLMAKRDTSIGAVMGRVDYYNISDTNTVWSSDLRLTSNLRPFGSALKPFIGLETRKAMFNSPNYWSPQDGSGNLYMGLQGDWQTDAWSLFGSGQVGFPVYGDAGQSWSASAGAKRWLTRTLALSFNLWAMATTRDGSSYRAQSAFINLEKLWR